MFGGSIMRRTDVNGLSDIDVLLIVNQSSLASRPPAEVIEYVKDIIVRRMPRNPVRAGKLAVTVGYSGGNEIQLLPAIRTQHGVRIAEPGKTKWSNVIQPDKFATRLAKLNETRDGRVVPTIKLAKAIADCFITRPSRKISGYHMEALAIEALNNYRGPLDPRTMLNHLFGNAITGVMRPIADLTGQSMGVDEHLGPAGSKARQRASTYFGQMRSKVNSCRTEQDFDELFCQRD